MENKGGNSTSNRSASNIADPGLQHTDKDQQEATKAGESAIPYHGNNQAVADNETQNKANSTKGSEERVTAKISGGSSLGKCQTGAKPCSNTNEQQDIKGVEGKKRKEYCDDNGKPYRVGDDLLPNNTYEINGYTYETDDNGRIISAEGTLHLKDREGRLTIRDSKEKIGKGDEKKGDDRGHLIGDQFDGSNGLENMVPQDSKINRKDYRNFENELAREVKNGKTVYNKVEPVYNGNSRRPVAIVVTYSIDGEESVRLFPN